jgi:hypothetical protein
VEDCCRRGKYKYPLLASQEPDTVPTRQHRPTDVESSLANCEIRLMCQPSDDRTIDRESIIDLGIMEFG